MLDSSLVQSKFVGRDGFRWWIGQIPQVSAQGNQVNGGGWGNRSKVRIMGYHPYSAVELPDEDLPWAQVLLPTTAGTGAANSGSNVKLHPGDTVFGFFMDGDNAQIPVIVGCFGRTSQVPSTDYRGPFIPFTGYTDKIKNDGSRNPKNETNEQNAASAKAPRNVSTQQAQSIGPKEVSYFRGIGDIVSFATTSPSSFINKITTEVNNLVQKIQKITSDIKNAAGRVKDLINKEIKKVTAKIQKISSGLVGSMINGLYQGMAPVLNAGLKALYKTVYSTVLAATKIPAFAHRAGVAAQAALVKPISEIQNLLPCIANKILGTIAGTIGSVLSSVVNNVSNFVSCVATQFVASLVNFVIGGVGSQISSAMQAVSKISGGFSVTGFLRGNSSLIGGLIGSLSCNEVSQNNTSNVQQWEIGKGAKQDPGIPIDDILKSANEADALAQSAITLGESVGGLANSIGMFGILNSSISSPSLAGIVGACYAGPPVTCGKTKINIFGTNGSGATAIPVFGSIVGTVGSVIGAIITNSGSGYDFPPFVEITDACNQGYGAIGRAMINDNGEVTSIYIVSEGENYPIGSEPEEHIVENIDVVDPGTGYKNTDIVQDNIGIGNTYIIETTPDGKITKIKPINILTATTPAPATALQTVTDLPTFTVKSETGSGAIIKANLAPKPKSVPQGQIEQNIDCITK